MSRSMSALIVPCLALIALSFATLGARAEPMSVAEMDARMTAASDLLEAMGGRDSVMDQINRVVPVQVQALQGQFPNMTTETRRLIEQSMREEMTKGVNQLLAQMAAAWARRFTTKELREIAAFHRSPTGQTLRKQQEDLQREIAEIGRGWGVEIGRRIQERLQEHLSKPPALTS